MKIPAKGFTHGGKFHADDVFATALLMIVRPDIKVTRGFVVPDGFDGIVYDVGCGMFDHHQEPRESRPNGVPYAAFGLLWRVLGAQLVGSHQARLLEVGGNCQHCAAAEAAQPPANRTPWPMPSAALTPCGIPAKIPMPASGAPCPLPSRCWKTRLPQPTP